MTSQVFICNLALTHIGKPPISVITEASAEARACRQFYDHVIKTALQSHPWRWAGKTEAIAEIANTKNKRWKYAYNRPNDCLKIKRVTDELMLDYMPNDGVSVVAGGFTYNVEGKTIYCNVSPAYLEYTRFADDPTDFPPDFVDVISWRLASYLAMPLTQDLKRRGECYRVAAEMQIQAEVSDANEVRQTSDFPAQAHEARE